LQKVLANEGTARPTVIWLNGANCTGCTISLANLISSDEPYDVADLLVRFIDLAFHPNLMTAAGGLAVDSLMNASDGDYILAMDGGIPTAFDGYTCMLYTDSNGREVTAKEAVLSLAPQAMANLCIGTCASFGGIPSAYPNPTGIKSVGELTGLPTINIPGCPTHPDWIVWTVAQLLTGAILELDDEGRPAALFRGETHNVHKNCPRKGQGEAKTFGEYGERCLKELGCKGPQTQADCPTRRWNNGTNWCVGASAVCLGCTEKDFPDKFSPFYKISYTSDHFTFRLTKAEWRSDKSEVKVDGEGHAGAKVVVMNAGTQAILGTANVDGDGKWRFRLKNPTGVPCRVRAECNGQFLERDVLNAPEDCVDVTPDIESDFEMTKAEWRSDKSELKVDGKGHAGAKVVVKNAGTKAILGTANVDGDGKWRFRLKNPAGVPRRVRAECNGQFLERDVRNAPEDSEGW